MPSLTTASNMIIERELSTEFTAQRAAKRADADPTTQLQFHVRSSKKYTWPMNADDVHCKEKRGDHAIGAHAWASFGSVSFRSVHLFGIAKGDAM